MAIVQPDTGVVPGKAVPTHIRAKRHEDAVIICMCNVCFVSDTERAAMAWWTEGNIYNSLGSRLWRKSPEQLYIKPLVDSWEAMSNESTAELNYIFDICYIEP